MKKNIHILVFLVASVILAAGCKTASKLYEKGNYQEAVELATKKLRKNPGDAQLRSVLIDAYRFAVNDHERRIREYSASSNELKSEWIYQEYMSLQDLAEVIWGSPEATSLVNPEDYSSYLNTYAEKAAGVRYDRGMRWMEQPGRESMKQAYREFSTAIRYMPGDTDILNKMQEAYDRAVINVVVLPFDQQRFRYSSYFSRDTRFREDELVRRLSAGNPDMFVKFYTDWDARNRQISPDQFIDIRFTEIKMGRTRDEKTTRQVSKEVVVKETVYSKDSVVKEYKKVYAKITTTKRSILSEGKMYVDIRDVNGLRLWSRNLGGEHRWQTEFATYTGDERALSDQDKALLNRAQDQPPNDEEIVRQIMNQITADLYTQVRNFYRAF